MSITPKVDEIRFVVLDLKIDIAAFTETWLRYSIQDNIIDIPGYKIYIERTVMVGYMAVWDGIRTTILNDLHLPTLEVLWIKLRPKRLPRGIPSIIAGTIYHPPSSDNQAIINNLIETLTSIEANNPNCGIIVMGDLNRLNTSHINCQFKLKQLVKFSTRGRHTLDVILTNLSQFYDQPEKLSPFGLSDHFTIKVLPMIRSKRSDNIKILRTRDTSESSKIALGRVLSGIDWSCLHNLRTCDDKFAFFNDVLPGPVVSKAFKSLTTV